MAKTIQVWDGKGVLSVGRKKIKVGEEIPANLDPAARKSLKAKGFITEVVAEEKEATETDAAKLAQANTAADDAKELADKCDIEKLTKAVQTAKGARTKAEKANDTDKLTSATAALADAETELADAHALAENAVRLRMEADKLANG